MKKFLPYILILTVIVQLFAPFSVGSRNKNGFSIVKESKAEAADESTLGTISQDLRKKAKDDCLNYSGVTLKEVCWEARASLDGNAGAAGLFIYLIGRDYVGNDKYNFNLTITANDGTVVTNSDNELKETSIDQDSDLNNINDKDGEIDYDGYSFVLNPINGLIKNRIYSVKIDLEKEGGNVFAPDTKTTLTLNGIYIPENGTQTTTGVNGDSVLNNSGLPECRVDFWNTIGGCFGQLLYWAIFRPVSLIFGLTGKLLDITIMHSISDASYRSTFVVEGWQIIRDFCNMFFIFVLLYIAFGTILKLHAVKTQEMIVNVVIIGLLINFSLFATQVIIDASNILARVFYSDNAMVIKSNGKEAGRGDAGEIKLSEAIVGKVNPVELVTSAGKVGRISVKNGVDDSSDSNSISAGSFIIVILLSAAICVVGIIAFLSSSLIFITRIIGLWLAMILAPIAFFSYIIPQLQDTKMIGWKKWWPDTLKMAFLAPIFMFFMYLIVKFLDKGLGLSGIDALKNGDGLSFIIGIMFPFIAIMILLMKAKNIAKDMSGELGQSITKGIAAVGGIALGAAAGGVALAGRQVIGRGMAKMSRGDTSTQKYMEAKRLKATGDSSAWDKLNWRQKAIGATTTVSGRVKTDKLQTWTGGLLNKAQEKVGKTDKARHKEDEVKKALGLENVDNTNLSGTDIKNMQNKYKEMEGGNVEAQFRKGVDAKGAVLSMTDSATGNTYTGESDFKARNRQSIINDVHAGGDPNDIDFYSGELTDAGKKKVEDQLTVKLNAIIKENADSKVVEKFNEMRRDASTHVNPALRGFSGANKSSYDIRKISEMKTDQREGFLTKGTVGLAALIAGGVRSGIRGSGFGNSKIKVEGDFLKDLGSTISDSLKNMKVNVDLSHVGEHKSSADAHGGGGHH